MKVGTRVRLIEGLNLSVDHTQVGTLSHICNYNNVEREHLKRVRAQEKLSNTEEAKLRKDQQKAKTPEDKEAVVVLIENCRVGHAAALYALDLMFQELIAKELVVVSYPTVLVTADPSELIVVEEKAAEAPDEREVDYSGFE